MSGAADAGHDPQVQVELSEAARLSDTPTHVSKVPVGQLAAANGQQPDAVLLQAFADVLDLSCRQQLSCDLDGSWKHPGLGGLGGLEHLNQHREKTWQKPELPPWADIRSLEELPAEPI